MPGSSLLSHGETPHYHRRYGVSLLSSAWGQVGPPRYSRQANLGARNESFTSWPCCHAAESFVPANFYPSQAENLSLKNASGVVRLSLTGH